jgi:uncharacterized protein (TIGR00369 family)
MTDTSSNAAPPSREDIAKLVGLSPQARALGLAIDRAQDARAWGRAPFRDALIGDAAAGVIAGGVVTTFLDSLCGAAVFIAADEPAMPATIDLRIDYMRAAKAGADILAEAHCYKLARSVAFVRAIAYEQSPDDPVAHAAGVFMRTGAGGRGPGANLEPRRRSTLAELAAADGPSAQTRLDEYLQRFPYARFLGVRAALHGDELTLILPYSEHLIGNPLLPALHGGVVGAFMELAALIQLGIANDGRRGAKTIDIHIDYLRSGRPMDTFARARVNKIGRRIAHVAVEAWQDERANPIAALRGHFLMAEDES